MVLFDHMLELRSKARRKLLAFYFTNPAARHHLRDLAQRLKVDPSNLSKELGRLEPINAGSITILAYAEGGKKLISGNAPNGT